MKKTLITALIISIVGLTPIIRTGIIDKGADKEILIGMMLIGILILCIFLGAVMMIFKSTEKIAKGILLGMGIILLIGFAVCTINF